jgi:putative membrane protein
VSAKVFFEQATRDRVAEAIRAVEAQTAAEVVVAVRPSSGSYRSVDLVVGITLAMGALCLFLFHPEPFDYDVFPLEMLAVLVIGTIASEYLTPLRRALASSKAQRDNVVRAAKAAFVDLGVHRCKGRNGVLVYVSMFERDVEVVGDVGIDPEALGAPWKDAVFSLRAAIARGARVERFLAGLAALGPALAEAFPRAHDDENELSDEVHVEEPVKRARREAAPEGREAARPLGKKSGRP